MNKVNGKRKLANLSYFCKCSGRVDLASKKLPKLSKLSLETLKLSKRLDISNMFRHLKRTNPKTHNMWLHVYTKRIDTFITNRKTQTQINQPKHVPHQLQLSYSRSRGHGLSVSHPKINLYVYIYIYFLPLFYIYSCKIIPILWQASKLRRHRSWHHSSCLAPLAKVPKLAELFGLHLEMLPLLSPRILPSHP